MENVACGENWTHYGCNKSEGGSYEPFFLWSNVFLFSHNFQQTWTHTYKMKFHLPSQSQPTWEPKGSNEMNIQYMDHKRNKRNSKQHITKCFSCKTPLVQSVFFSSMNVSSRQLHINNMLLWTFQLHRLWGFTECRPTFWLWAALNTHSSYDREPIEI